MRFVAAFVVFAGHLSGSRFTGGLFWQVGAYAADAVTVFFVLSGFVIGFVTERHERDAASYAVNRMARVASVALPAIVLTLVLDRIGRSVAPALYSADWGYSSARPLLQAATAATFTQKLWWDNLTIGSDLPYWSLNYEVWYYVLFGVARFCAGWRRSAAILAAVAAVCGPAILLLFPLWLMGLASQRWRLHARLGPAAGWLAFAGSLAAFVLYEAWAWHSGRPLGALGPASRREVVQDYLVALLFVANLTGFQAIAPRLPAPPAWLARPIRALAARTFSLYLFHLPIAQCLAALDPLPPDHPASRVLLPAATLALVFALAQVTELRKESWRGWIRSGLARLGWTAPTAA